MKSSRLFWASFVCLALVLLLMALGYVMGQDPNAIDPMAPTQAPSVAHWFGTDELGRDLFARLSRGAFLSLVIGVATAAVSVGVGTTYGLVCAHQEGKPLDAFLMRVLDVIYSLPGLMLVILLSLFLGRTVLSLVLAISVFSWPDTARLIRSQVIQLHREEFTEAFTSLGGGRARLIIAHELPNLLPYLLLSATMTIPRAILTESTLSFVGLGVAPPYSSWGTMIQEGWQMIRLAPHLVLLPAGFLLLTMVALNVLGDSFKPK